MVINGMNSTWWRDPHLIFFVTSFVLFALMSEKKRNPEILLARSPNRDMVAPVRG
jgi:hypothetical protein